MQRVLPQARAILLELQLLASRLAAQDVVQIARLVTGEKDNFGFLLTFGHATNSRQIAPLSRRSRLSIRSRILAGIAVNQKAVSSDLPNVAGGRRIDYDTPSAT